MPDWDAPFHLPRLSTEEFQRRRANYIARHGYSITIPGFEDIVHLPVERPVTVGEQQQWVRSGHGDLSPERIEEISYIKRRNKERFLNMLGSASPDVFRNHASLMTSMDDCQDALSTAATVGIAASRLLPRTLASAIQGPVGWTLAAADMLNMVMTVQRGPMAFVTRKKAIEETTELNPFNKKARAKRTRRIHKMMPGKGAMIEALQTTDQIFGFGISLGQLMNLPVEIIAGNVHRFIRGRRVRVNYPIPDPGHWYRAVQKLSRGIGLMWGTHHATDDNFLASTLVGYNLVNQIDRAQSQWDSIDIIHDIRSIIIRAPAPENLITREIYEEEGLNPDDFRGWPGVNKEWATFTEIHEATYPVALDNFRSYCQRNKHNFTGMIAAMNAVEGSLVHMGNYQGTDSVAYDYTANCKVFNALLNCGYYMPEKVRPEDWDAFLAWIQTYEDQGICPSIPVIVDTARDSFNIEFTNYPPGAEEP